MERAKGIEPSTCSLGSYRSATELRPRGRDASLWIVARLGRSLQIHRFRIIVTAGFIPVTHSAIRLMPEFTEKWLRATRAGMTN